MKKFGFASVVATGFAAALFALAAPAAADMCTTTGCRTSNRRLPSVLPPRLSATAADNDVQEGAPGYGRPFVVAARPEMRA